MCAQRGIKTLTYGRDGRDIKLRTVRPEPAGIGMEIEIDRKVYPVHLPLIGVFQVMNALAALGMVIAGGESVETAMAALETLTGVRGRMEPIGTVDGAAILVDFAHTPDGLATMLAAARPHCQGRLICLFGCGGDRDAGKRPLMAKAVGQLADIGILTDDNPRTESPAQIRADAKIGFPEAIEIGDRAEAIRHGISILQPGDVLILAGKGHETGQTVGTEVLPFDDAEVARNVLREMGDAQQ
jgi:UDP-N-acetylmuramoyl-L-alanyl-D-glutamate--2,6-diaminopimelate ligase